MAILKTALSRAVLLAVWTILGSEGLLDIPGYLPQETHADVYVPLEHFRQKRERDRFEELALSFSGDDNMTLQCDSSVKIDGSATWEVKGRNVTNNSKYKINDEKSSLTVVNLITADSGLYKCSLKDAILEFNQRESITVLKAPILYVENEVIYSLCNATVPLNCCGEANDFRLEWLDQSGETLVESDENFDCNDATYGLGKEGNTTAIGCVNSLEGQKTARCENGTWVFVRSTCLSPQIKELQLESQSLAREGIVVFAEKVFNVTNMTTAEVVNSTANILAIVDTLNNVINVINNTDVPSSVIENFLKTVDILVREETEGTWAILNADNNTNVASSDLLFSVEKIVEVIENTTISITTSTMQLNKTIFDDDFNKTFNSANSTDELMLKSITHFYSEITTVHFSTLHIVLPPQNLTSSNNTINGAVILVYTNSSDDTNTNITLTFEIRNTTLVNPQCVFWNFSETAWDSSGCEVQTDGNETITCFCDHLTSFSILMSPYIPEEVRTILDFITYIGGGISMGSLVLCLIIEGIVWSAVTRNDAAYMRHVSIVNIALSLLIANIWFMIGAGISDIDQMSPVGPCSAATFFINFFYLAFFFWMLISGLLVLYHMVMVFSHMSKRTMMAISFIVGYGAPLIIAAITVAVTAPQNGYFRNDDACWKNWFGTMALLAFVIPALTIVAINFFILIVVLYKLLRRGMRDNQADERNALIVIARCVAFLTPFFGLTWGFGIGTMVAPESVGLHIVFAILNSLQGLFVLLFGTLLDSRIRAALAGWFSFLRTSSNPTRSTSGGPPSSSGLGLFLRRTGAYHVSEVASSSQSTAASESFLNT